MDDTDREHLAARLLAGRDLLVLDHEGAARPFALRPPTPLDRLHAAQAAAAARAAAAAEGVVSADEALALLRRGGAWSPKDDADYQTAAENLDKLKLALWEAKTNREREATRGYLRATRDLLRVLSGRRAEARDKTLEGAAEAARVRCLVGRCLEREDGAPAFPHGYAVDRSPLLAAAVAAYAATRATEAEVREVARTEPWRSVWAAREACGGAVFPGPAAALTDEQRLLVVWTRLYDNAAQDPDGPGEDALADDDLFDGWLLHRRKGRGDETARRVGGVAGERVAGMDEVFLCGAPPGEALSGFAPEELAAADRLNTPQAARLKARRAAEVARKGALHEAELSDVRQDLVAELERMKRT